MYFMKKFDDTAHLGHNYDAICCVETYINGIDKSTFLSNEMMQDAIVRQIEIIGEASRHVSEELQEKHPELYSQQELKMLPRAPYKIFGGCAGFQLRSENETRGRLAPSR